MYPFCKNNIIFTGNILCEAENKGDSESFE